MFQMDSVMRSANNKEQKEREALQAPGGTQDSKDGADAGVTRSGTTRARALTLAALNLQGAVLSHPICQPPNHTSSVLSVI